MFRMCASSTAIWRARPTRTGSRSEKTSGSGFPAIKIWAPFSAPRRARRSTIHEPSAGVVGRVRHGPNEVDVLHEPVDRDVLILSHVRSDANEELRVAAQTLFVVWARFHLQLATGGEPRAALPSASVPIRRHAMSDRNRRGDDADSVVERANAVTVRFARPSEVLPGAASGTRQSELITPVDANRAPVEDVAFVRAAKAEAARLTRSRRLKVAKRTKCGERGTAPR